MKDERTNALKAMYSPDGSPLRNYQMHLLEILKEIDSFCRKNDIEYSLSDGTLLGAMRHEGFIPWDDDADVMMTRANFEKLKSLCDENGKLNDKLSITYNFHPTFSHKGIIDIFVQDYCPDNKLKRFIKLTAARIIGLMIKCKLRVYPHVNLKPFKPWCVLIPFAIPFNLKKMQRAIQKVSVWWNKPSKHLACYTDSVKDMGHIYPVETMDGYMDIQFEGHTFMAVRNYEMHLKEMYGDWRQIPQEKDRVWLARVESNVKIKRK